MGQNDFKMISEPVVLSESMKLMRFRLIKLQPLNVYMNNLDLKIKGFYSQTQKCFLNYISIVFHYKYLKKILIMFLIIKLFMH